jgi:hypothetical protein
MATDSDSWSGRIAQPGQALLSLTKSVQGDYSGYHLHVIDNETYQKKQVKLSAATEHGCVKTPVELQVATKEPNARKSSYLSSLSPIQEDTADGKTEFMGDKPRRSLLYTKAKEDTGYSYLTMRPADASSQCGAEIKTVVEGSTATGTEKGDEKEKSRESRSSHGPSTQNHERI